MMDLDGSELNHFRAAFFSVIKKAPHLIGSKAFVSRGVQNRTNQNKKSKPNKKKAKNGKKKSIKKLKKSKNKKLNGSVRFSILGFKIEPKCTLHKTCYTKIAH